MIRRLCAALALLCLVWMVVGFSPAHANCTAPCTRSQINTDITTNWPDNSSGAITPALLRSTVLDIVNSYFALVDGPIYVPSLYGAKCDGATDDTVAFQSMATAIVAAGGGTVEMPAGATCIIYNSGQSVANPLFQLNTGSPFQLKAFIFKGNGATFSIGHTFLTSETLSIFNVVEQANVQIDGINVTQQVPISTGGGSPYGTVILNALNNSGTFANNVFNISLTNSTLTGGEAPFQANNTNDVFITNVSSISSFYGIVSLDGVSGLTAKNVFSNGNYRDIFLKGTSNADVSVTSINPISNTVLLSADVNNAILENIRINYKVLKRTAASSSPASYVYIGEGSVASVTGAIYKNMRINLDIDMSGDTGSLAPAVQFRKATTSSLSSSYQDIEISGSITGVPNSAGNVIDLFDTADQPWSGETAQNISIRNLYVTGSTTPSFYVDYAPFQTLVAGAFSLENIIFPGAYSAINNSNQSGQLAAKNVNFSGGPLVLNTSFGGTGLFQPTAHSILQGEGSAAIGLITAATAGKIIIDQGSGADWLPKAVSGDATLAASGAVTLASTIAAGGPTGSSSVVPVITYDAKGRLTTVTTATITPAAIAAVATVKKQIFTSSGTYTPSTGMLYAIIECVGSGGSGGGGTGVATGFLVGGGGGAGSYSRAVVSAATVGVSQVVTVGNGGTAPAAGNTNGGNGADVSVGTLCVGKGGSGGAFASSGQVGTGGAGGVSGTGDLAVAGPPGFGGTFANGTANILTPSGTGGNSFFGGGAAAASQAGGGTTTTGIAGGNYGGGGGGGNANSTTNTFAGGNGGKGVVFITEFNSQ